MHELLPAALSHLITLSYPHASESTTASGIKVALVTGAFMLAATFITVLGQRRDRDSPNEALEMRNAQRNLDRQVARAERAEHRCEVLTQENSRLREFLRALGHDPDADPDSVRSPA